MQIEQSLSHFSVEGLGTYKRQQGADGAGTGSLVTGVPGFSGTDIYWDSFEEL